MMNAKFLPERWQRFETDFSKIVGIDKLMQLKDGLAQTGPNLFVAKSRGARPARWEDQGMALSGASRPLLEQVLRQQALMERMMTTCGVDMSKAASVDGGLALLEASCKCSLCPDEPTCVRWLDGADARAEVDTPPEFCPNAKLFKSARDE